MTPVSYTHLDVYKRQEAIRGDDADFAGKQRFVCLYDTLRCGIVLSGFGGIFRPGATDVESVYGSENVKNSGLILKNGV